MQIKDPVFIIGCPRSGTTLLSTILGSSPELWASYRESHYLWEKFLPDPRDWIFSMYMGEDDFKEEDKKYLDNQYHKFTFNNKLSADLIRYVFLNNSFKAQLKPLHELFSELIVKPIKSLLVNEYRILDKTPPNTYRVSYLAKAYPDAKFIYIVREGKTNISSLIEGWRSEKRFNFSFRKFWDYNKRLKIKGYNGKVWKFTNPPGWEEYLDKSLEEVCAFQWLSAHKYTQESLSKIDPKRWTQIRYEDLTSNPEKHIRELCMFIDIPFEGEIKKQAEDLPVVSTNTKPNPDKWKKNAELLARIEPMIQAMQEKLGYEPSRQAIKI